jgi:YbgC/YbaW family acyl-CoA thioester hydrolase
MTINRKRSDFRCISRMRVRWAEVDMQKIVFNAHYLMYFDTAMADYWRALALPYEAAMHHLGGDVYLKKASVEYFASARYDEQIEIGMRCARVGNSSLVFEGAVFRGNETLVTGDLIYVYADPATQKSQPVPAALRSVFEGFESGQAMVSVELGDMATLRAKVDPLRQTVFVQEQGIDAKMVWDEADASALHAVLVNHLGQPVGSGRLLQHAPQVARIGRMAVDQVLRGGNWGKTVLSALMDAARARGDTSVILHAQCTAQGFYERLGFKTHGSVFQEAGIDHVEMSKSLEKA